MVGSLISGIMVVTVSWGWFANGGDPAFGRHPLGKNIPHPHDIGGMITWLFLLPPLCLVILTRMGIPVSTSLLVLTIDSLPHNRIRLQVPRSISLNP